MNNSGRRTVGLWLIGVLLMQVAWIITIPPFRGSDEFDHAYRAAAVARGDWVAGDRADDGRGWLVEVPESLVAAANGQCEYLPYTGPQNCSPAADTEDGNVLVASSAAGYHPAFYWVIGSVALPFEGAAALYALRIATALLCVLFMGGAAWALTRLPTRWPMAALILATSPVFVYSTAVAAPNGLEMSAGVSLWASLMALAHEGRQSPRRLLWLAIGSAAALGTLRLTGPLFILLIAATVVALNGNGVWVAVRRHPGTTVGGVCLVGLAVLTFAWWTFGPLVLESGETSGEGAKTLSYRKLIRWPLQSIAAFPLHDQMGAMIVYPVVLILVGALVVLALGLGTPYHRWVLGGSLLTALLVPLALTLATLEGRGVIWQGRYGLPYSVGFILIAGYMIGRRSAHPELSWKLTVPALAFYGLAIAACLVKIRDDELSKNVASIQDPSWHAPPAMLPVALIALVMVCFAFALSGRSREPV